MRVMFDTNIYISFIRNRSHASELVRGGTVKYVSAIVLMELKSLKLEYLTAD